MDVCGLARARRRRCFTVWCMKAGERELFASCATVSNTYILLYNNSSPAPEKKTAQLTLPGNTAVSASPNNSAVS